MNELFGGNDAGGRHFERGHTSNVWLAFADSVRADEPQALHAVVLAAYLERDKFRFFMWLGGDHKFSAMAERNVVLGAEFVGESIAFHAQARLERVFRIINSGMVDPAVARAGGHADLGKLLDKK